MSTRMQDKRAWLVGGAVGAVVVAGASWMLAISPVLSDTNSIHDQRNSVRQQNVVAQHNLAKLASTKAQMGSLQRQLASALVALPMDNGLPNFTRQLTTEARLLHLSINSVTVGSFSSTTAQTTTAQTTTASGSTDTAAATTGSSANGTTPATGTAATSGAPVAIGVTVNSFGSVVNQLAFLRVLRTVGPRCALVTQVSLNAVAKTETAPAGYSMSTQLTIFATPKTTAERAQLQHLLTQK